MALIICKKCSGNHLTIKCGKETKVITGTSTSEKSNNRTRTSDKGNNYTNNNYTDNSKNSYFEKRQNVTVKLSNLPDDITENELEGLLQEWGSIGRINVSSFENKAGYIDFHFKNEAEYFIEAIDRTAFDSVIIRAELIDRGNKKF